MNYIEIIETWLRNYNEMKLQSASLKEAYAEKEKEAKEGHAIDYSRDKLSDSHKFNSEVENLALDLALISDRIKHLDNKLDILDKAIERLSVKEIQIIKLRYIERKRIKYTDQWRNYTWREISQMVGYEESWCRRMKKTSIEKLTNVMFGEKAR